MGDDTRREGALQRRNATLAISNDFQALAWGSGEQDRSIQIKQQGFHLGGGVLVAFLLGGRDSGGENTFGVFRA
jgi:hypothetical protein